MTMSMTIAVTCLEGFAVSRAGEGEFDGSGTLNTQTVDLMIVVAFIAGTVNSAADSPFSVHSRSSASSSLTGAK